MALYDFLYGSQFTWFICVAIAFKMRWPSKEIPQKQKYNFNFFVILHISGNIFLNDVSFETNFICYMHFRNHDLNSLFYL